MGDFENLRKLILTLPADEYGSGASQDEIATAERAMEIKLEGGYRRFIERFGWLATSGLDIYGLGAGKPKYLDLVEVTQSERTEMHPRLRRDLLPVMNDGFGNLYCVDTSSAGLPIVFWNHEAGPDQVPEPVSPSFEEWLVAALNDAMSP